MLMYCSHFFVTSYFKKNMNARRGRTTKVAQSRRKRRTYRPTTSTYLVDLLEEQPGTICSEKGKTRFYRVKHGKTCVYPSRLEISRFWKGIDIIVYI